MNSNATQKQQLRETLRQKRIALSPEEQHKKAKQLLAFIAQRPEFISSQHIAGYWPIEGEINPLPLLEEAFTQDKQCYLPVLSTLKTHELFFVEYQRNDPLTPNRFGILEPSLPHRRSIQTWDLNLIFIPMVAFDEEGCRLGTGGGYYDRTLAFIKDHTTSSQPFLLGLGYEWQCVAKLPEDSWDITLNGIATEARYITIKP